MKVYRVLTTHAVGFEESTEVPPLANDNPINVDFDQVLLRLRILNLPQ